MEDSPRPFFEHLEELRRCLIKALLAVVLAAGGVYFYTDPLIRFLARPVGHFVFLRPTEAFMAQLKIAFGGGAVLAMPVVLYQIWRFVAVALTPREKRSIFWLLPVSYALFLAGLLFGFFVLVPQGMRFLLGCASPVLAASISIDAYVGFLGAVCLTLGALFQMPLAAFFAARFGLLSADWLAEKRRPAVLVLYVASALLTPGPDPVTALLLFLPSYALFELSILAARWAGRRQKS